MPGVATVTGRRPFLLLLGTLVAGCGFSLRRSFGVPQVMARTHLIGPQRSEIYVGLRRSLAASGVTLVETPAEAGAILRLSRERGGRRVLSVGRDARVNEYEVYSTVTFELLARGEDANRAIIEPQTLRLTREYLYDATGVLGKSDEEALLRQEMQRDLVRLIMYRLEAAGG